MKSITWLASLATIFGVSISNLIRFWGTASFWVKLFLILALAATVMLAILDAQAWWRSRLRRHKSEQSVNGYMLKLLKRGGATAIFAHNLSWVRNAPEIHDFLTTQAKGGRDVRLFVPCHNDLTRELAAAGVKVRTYSKLAYNPGARFTLLNCDEPGSSLLAIGKGIFPNFYIEEFSDQTHSRVIAVVRDLLNILERVNDNANT